MFGAKMKKAQYTPIECLTLDGHVWTEWMSSGFLQVETTSVLFFSIRTKHFLVQFRQCRCCKYTEARKTYVTEE